MSLNKRLTKPSLGDIHDTFLYGKECGIDQERDRIISLLKANRDLDNELIDSIIDLVRGDIDV